MPESAKRGSSWWGTSWAPRRNWKRTRTPPLPISRALSRKSRAPSICLRPVTPSSRRMARHTHANSRSKSPSERTSPRRPTAIPKSRPARKPPSCSSSASWSTPSSGAGTPSAIGYRPSTSSCYPRHQMTYLALLAIGLVAGVFAGMFGIGGGLIIVPALLFLLKMTELEAIATSLAALIPPVGLLGAAEYYTKGYIHVRYALLIALGIFVGAYFGAH